MIEGRHHDDRYKMVEDEFYAIAQSFTQHLHHAEYKRLEALAISQHASTTNLMRRPVDPNTQMSAELSRNKDAEAKAKKRNAAVKYVAKGKGVGYDTEDGLGIQEGISELEDDGYQNPWVGTSLQGLMTESKKSQTTLSQLSEYKSHTRAALGFSQSSGGTSKGTSGSSLLPPPPILDIRTMEDSTTDKEEDDDDLDAPVITKVRPLKPLVPPSQNQRSPPRPNLTRKSVERTAKRPPAPTSHPNSASKHHPTVLEVPVKPRSASLTTKAAAEPPQTTELAKPAKPLSGLEMPSDDDIFTSTASASLLKRRAETKARRLKREREEKSALAFEIPTFLV